jgi:hypothetical protein
VFGNYDNSNLEQIIIPLEKFSPFPTADQHVEWESLPKSLREKQIKEGEKYLNYQWSSLPATLFMEFGRNGNRTRFQEPHYKRREALTSLVIAECMEGKGRFIDDIINGVWCICEESFWGVSAHNYVSKRQRSLLPDVSEPIIDLFAGETAGLLAWIYYLLRSELDNVSVLVSKRIRKELKQRILDPYLERDDFWWMGLNTNRKVNNWNPWCNSNCLTAFLLLEKDPQRRTQAVAKTLRSLDRFLNVYHNDGGCDEGTSYWDRAGGALFDCLELLYSATNGKISLYDEPLIKEIGRFLYRGYIDGDYFINFADGDAKVKISADLVNRYGRRINDQELMALGASAHPINRDHNDVYKRRWNLLQRQIPALFNYEKITAAESKPIYIKDTWLNGIQVMASREQQESAEGLYLAAKGGHNDESHNHNDVGQFIIYANGRPLVIDVGVETYTAKTFSADRYEIWTMQSAYHNLPTVNGIQQNPGGDYKATQVDYQVDDKQVGFSFNIDSAYPKEAGIESWKRYFKFNRDENPYIKITDDFKLKNDSEDIKMSLMVPYEPQFDESSSIIIQDADLIGVRVDYDADTLSVSSERIPIEDDRLQPVWGEQLYRITLKANAPLSQAVWELKVHQL